MGSRGLDVFENSFSLCALTIINASQDSALY